MPEARTLHHDEVVEAAEDGPERWIAVLHGIYGAGRNWNSVARRVVRERPEWGAVMVDLREHGRSRGFEPPHTVEAAARDLLRTARADDLPLSAVLGHSFGGKVALEYVRAAEGEGAPLPRQVWIVDSTPQVREPDGSAWGMLGVLRRHAGPFRSRDAAVAALESDGVARPIARWFATNLEDRGDGAWEWRLDPDVMEELLRDFFAQDSWDLVESPPGEVEIHVVRATESSILSGDGLARMRAAAAGSERVHLHEVEGGHWLNADNPDALVELLVGTLG